MLLRITVKNSKDEVKKIVDDRFGVKGKYKTRGSREQAKELVLVTTKPIY
jgi:hypothetical protein